MPMRPRSGRHFVVRHMKSWSSSSADGVLNEKTWQPCGLTPDMTWSIDPVLPGGVHRLEDQQHAPGVLRVQLLLEGLRGARRRPRAAPGCRFFDCFHLPFPVGVVLQREAAAVVHEERRDEILQFLGHGATPCSSASWRPALRRRGASRFAFQSLTTRDFSSAAPYSSALKIVNATKRPGDRQPAVERAGEDAVRELHVDPVDEERGPPELEHRAPRRVARRGRERPLHVEVDHGHQHEHDADLDEVVERRRGPELRVAGGIGRREHPRPEARPR